MALAAGVPRATILDLFLSRGYCGEDEFLSKEAVSYRIGTEVVVYCVYVRLKKLTNRYF